MIDSVVVFCRKIDHFTMKRKSQKILLAAITGFLLIMQIAARNHSDVILQIVNDLDDTVLQEKLIAFHRTGIGKKVDIGNYDPESVIEYAQTFIGTPHRMGGTSQSGIDCSGLVMLSHAKFNVSLPHASQEQARYGRIIPPGDALKKGDLLFFHSTYNTSRLITHSAIYIGDSSFIHTSASRGVVISSLKSPDYWKDHYLFATRLTE